MAKRRGRGTGSVFKRGKFFYLFTRVGGKAKLTSLRTANREEAEAKAVELAPALEADTKEKIALYVAEARKLRKKKSVRLADSFAFFLKSHERPDSGPRQLKDYEARWSRFCRFLESSRPDITRVGEIDRETAQGYAAWLESLGLSGKSFNDNIAMVSVVIRALSKEAGLDENPFDSIRRKSQEITHKKELSEAEALRLLDVFNNPAFNVMHKEELRLCFHLGMFSGLRFSDAVNLRFSQVSLADNLIRMKPAKTRRTSGITITVPIHPFLRSMIEDAERGRQEGEDFITPNLAKRFSYNKTGLNKDVIKVFEAAGFETREENKGVRAVNVYGFHSFRSTFCSFAARKGVPLSTLAQITGDNIQTLQKYYVRIDEKTAAQTLSALPMMKPALPAPPDTPAGKEAEARQALKELVDTADFKTVQKALKLFKAGRA